MISFIAILFFNLERGSKTFLRFPMRAYLVNTIITTRLDQEEYTVTCLSSSVVFQQ